MRQEEKKSYYCNGAFNNEILQLTTGAGTFDLWDILVEFLAEMVAVFIINKYTAER